MENYTRYSSISLTIENHVAVEQEQSRPQHKRNDQQHKQAAYTTTSTYQCALRTAHFSSSEDSPGLYTAVYIGAFRRMRPTHSAVVSKIYVEILNITRSKGRLLEKTDKKEQAASRESVGPKNVESDQKKKVVWIVRGEAPRNASPASVIFGVYRGHVFGVVAARVTASATAAAAAAAAFVMWVPLVAASKNNTKTCIVRTRRLIWHHAILCHLGKILVVAIKWLD